MKDFLIVSGKKNNYSNIINNLGYEYKSILKNIVYNDENIEYKIEIKGNLSILFFKNFKKKNNIFLKYNKKNLILLDGYLSYNESNYNKEVNIKNFIFDFEKNKRKAINNITDGKFNLFIYDILNNELHIINDRFGLNLFYYYSNKEIDVFSSSTFLLYKFLLNKGIKLNLSENNIEKFKDKGFYEGNKTYFNNVYCYNPGYYLTITDNSKKGYFYWKPKFNISNKSIKELGKDFSDLWIKIIGKYIKSFSNYKLASFLSGGYDSRLIVAGAYKNKLLFKIDTISFGYKNSDELKYINKLKKNIKNIKNKTFAFKEINIDSFFYTNGGFTNIIFNYIDGLGKIINNYDYIFDGYLGDTIIGGNYFHKPSKNPINILKDLLDINNDLNNDFLNKQLKQFDNKSIEGYLEEINNNNLNNIYKIDLVMQINRGRRYILYGPTTLRNYTEIILPFFNYKIYDFYLSIPWKYRINHKFYNLLFYNFFKKFNVGTSSFFGKISGNIYLNTFKRYTQFMISLFKNKIYRIPNYDKIPGLCPNEVNLFKYTKKYLKTKFK